MSKKPDTATALAGILKARRGPEPSGELVASAPAVAEADIPPTPSPAPLSPPAPASAPASKKGRNGKSSDPNYSQFSVYLRKTLRKKVGRALDDEDAGQDFSNLVESLLEQWIASRT